MAGWSDCATALTRILFNLQAARNTYLSGASKASDTYDDIGDLPSGDLRDVLFALLSVSAYNRTAIRYLVMEHASPDNYAWYYFLKNCTVGPDDIPEPEPITWKDIIMAWSEISKPARMWTITALDQMRQNIWNEPTKIKWQENPFE